MSYPYELDLMYNSEKSTVDNNGMLSFGKNGGGGGDDPSTPKTYQTVEFTVVPA